jgi:DNA-binding NarL/FixJ family response regulator
MSGRSGNGTKECPRHEPCCLGREGGCVSATEAPSRNGTSPVLDANGSEGDGRGLATLVVAGPHKLLLDALSRLLEVSGLLVLGRCTGSRELERCLRAHAPDLALIDTDLAEPTGLADLVQAARSAMPDSRLVLLAPALDRSMARASLGLEIDGLLLKTSSTENVVAALSRVLAGDAVFPAGLLSAARRRPEAELTARQREVLELLAQGLSNQAIADRLYISRNTVKFHVAAIYLQLGVTNRVQAAHALGELERATGS